MPLTPDNGGTTTLLNLMHVYYLLVVVVYCHRKPKAARCPEVGNRVLRHIVLAIQRGTGFCTSACIGRDRSYRAAGGVRSG